MAPISREHRPSRGMYRGQPLRFIKGHSSRKRPLVAPLPEDHKVCPDCGEVMPLNAFSPDRRNADGLAGYCKPCKARRGREYYERNAQDRRAYQRARIKTDIGREADMMATRKRRSAAKTGDNILPLIVLEHDDGVCGICGGDVDPLDFHIDHVIPLSGGGPHEYWNVQAAHPVCNQAKAAR